MSGPTRLTSVGALLLALVACGRPAARPPLTVRAAAVGAETRLILVAAPGWKINARLKPALETPEGAVLRFDAERLTPDSAYFAETPWATIPGSGRDVRGTLRASVCAPEERVCRAVTVAVTSAQ